MGNLTYISPVFPSLKKELQYLATRQAPNPTQSDLTKMIKVLAYINCHQEEAQVRFSGSDTQVYVHCDASYAAHPDGRSHTGYYISIGAASGAIRSYSAKQTHCVLTEVWRLNMWYLLKPLKMLYTLVVCYTLLGSRSINRLLSLKITKPASSLLKHLLLLATRNTFTCAII
jgi:hypothetical protein